VSDLEIQLLINVPGRVPDLTLTSGRANETASAKDLVDRLTLLQSGAYPALELRQYSQSSFDTFSLRLASPQLVYGFCMDLKLSNALLQPTQLEEADPRLILLIVGFWRLPSAPYSRASAQE